MVLYRDKQHCSSYPLLTFISLPHILTQPNYDEPTIEFTINKAGKFYTKEEVTDLTERGIKLSQSLQKTITSSDGIVHRFDETVNSKDDIRVTFKDGTEVET